jgi:hypothetical protein
MAESRVAGMVGAVGLDSPVFAAFRTRVTRPSERRGAVRARHFRSKKPLFNPKGRVG